MMNCEQITRVTGEFLDRRLRLREHFLFLLHIAMCKGCSNYVKQFRLTLAALQTLPAPLSPDVPQHLLEVFRQERHTGRK